MPDLDHEHLNRFGSGVAQLVRLSRPDDCNAAAPELPFFTLNPYGCQSGNNQVDFLIRCMLVQANRAAWRYNRVVDEVNGSNELFVGNESPKEQLPDPSVVAVKNISYRVLRSDESAHLGTSEGASS
jgi:hypothetical protein